MVDLITINELKEKKKVSTNEIEGNLIPTKKKQFNAEVYGFVMAWLKCNQ